MATLDLADRLALGPAFGPADRLHVVGAGSSPAPDLGPERGQPRPARDRGRPAGDPRRRRRPAAAGARRPPREADPGGRRPRRAARPTRSPRSTGRSRHGASRTSWTRGRARPSPRRSARTARSSWPAAGRPSRDGASACGRSRRPAAAPLGVVLVTPAVAVPTRGGLRALRRGRPAGGRRGARVVHAPRRRSCRPGSRRTLFLERAGVLAFANDLAPAAADLVPGLTRARRALSRLLERPVGQSGSGPTLWALSPSKADAVGDAAIIRAALADGLHRVPGRPPAVRRGGRPRRRSVRPCHPEHPEGGSPCPARPSRPRSPPPPSAPTARRSRPAASSSAPASWASTRRPATSPGRTSRPRPSGR